VHAIHSSAPPAKGAEALAELSALRLELPLIIDPRLRLEASLRLLAAWRTQALPERLLRADLLATLEQVNRTRADRALFREMLLQRLDGPAGADCAIWLLHSGSLIPTLDLVRTLLQRGHVDGAREYAQAIWGRHRLNAITLAASGVTGSGQRRRYVGRPEDAHRFPISRPLVVDCLRALAARTRPDPVLAERLRRLIWTLDGADRQAALAAQAPLMWRLGGEKAAWTSWRAIRYKSRKLQALEALVVAAHHDDRPDAAARFLRALPVHRHARCERLMAAPPPSTAVAWPLPALRAAADAVRASLRGAPLLPDHRRAFLSACARAPDRGRLAELVAPELRDSLLQLRLLLGTFGADTLWSGQLDNRREALVAAALPPHLALAATETAGRSPDVRDPGRARWDEALSLQADSHARRRVLARASKASLGIALNDPSAVPEDTLTIRLRTLAHLSGGVAWNALSAALKHQAAPEAALRMGAALDPGKALQTLNLMSLSPALQRAAIEELELRSALPAAATQRWSRLARLVNRRLGADAGAEWMNALLAHHTTFPNLQSLSELTLEVKHRETLPPYDRLLAETEAEVAGLMALDLADLAHTLARRPLLLRRLRWHQPPALAHGATAWTPRTWVSLLAAAEAIGEVDKRYTRRFTELLPDGPQLAESLLWGRCPTPENPTSLGKAGLRLRWLDKRLDLFTFLRFPDAASCCWQSQRGYSAPVRERILSLWKDPLSFCFLVERENAAALVPSGWRPVGFVFGSFALVNGEPAMMLNGLYLRQQNATAREQVLKAMTRFAQRLGLRWLALANRHGGSGHLPVHFRRRSRYSRRLRALRKNGALVTMTFDDIGRRLNVDELTTHLHWFAIPEASPGV